ncbi:MAG: hypothetical protein J0L67_21370 [Cytophagales bacterium]|nr:hypothetical protein [Cytophagales bacterium]
MNKLTKVLIALIIVANPSFGQIANLPDAGGAPLKAKKGEAMEGKIYLHEEWNKAMIEWKDGQTSENVFAKYNTLSGNLEVQKENGVWEYSPKSIDRFEYAVNFFPEVVIMKFEPSEKYFAGSKGFVKILFKDKIIVLERIDVEVVSAAASYGSSGSTTRIVQDSKSFIMLPDSKNLISFRRTNSSLSKSLEKPELKEYLKSKKLDVSNDKDLHLALGFLKTFYN